MKKWKRIGQISGIILMIFGVFTILAVYETITFPNCWHDAFGMTPIHPTVCITSYGLFFLGVFFLIGGGFLVYFARTDS